MENNDNYTTGDPIFEHGGESEREFATRTENAIDALIYEYLDDVVFAARRAKQGAFHSHHFAAASFRLARELERRRLGL